MKKLIQKIYLNLTLIYILKIKNIKNNITINN